ncbi:protein TBRG4 [Pseudomyrmex gracilis]|uniref:protein TBRG4 n=1 Tax=Pseudomyrmex gracilis TaxID=219809 RepID=UPI000995490C|nr:protein TBRG4 [Pseudomyrmex gracilis]XP_020278167.1 protein TBRG4 [Pseudomyrmex gracilis]
MTMLQFSATLYTATARLTPRSSWHFAAFIANNSSTATSSEQPVVSVKEENNVKFSEIQNNILQKEKDQKFQKIGTQTKIYSSEKKWLNENDKIFTKQFQAATSVNDLLDLAIIPNLSTVNALKLISSITNQINSGKSHIVNVEADERFIHLRKIVQFGGETKNISLSDDLSKYSQLSTPAMIAVIAKLREQGKRHTPLLRLLSYNIVKYNVKLNLKQCASLLYSMAVLNFPDMILLGKIVTDLLEGIPKNTKAVTNKSIITSLGFLHYKNERVLDAFSDTLYAESLNYKFQDYSSILQTFAALQYNTEKSRLFIEKFAELANQYQTDSVEWLDIVWSLAVLDAVQPCHVESVLDPKFVDNLIISTKLSVSKKLKLLNINGVAQFILKDYKGPFLNTDLEVFKNIPLVRAKEKQMYIEALSEALKKLLPSSSYFETNLDTNMGFLLDAEYRIDDQYKLIKVENWDEQSTNVKRIGIMIHDYHDYCRGQNDLIGSAYLYTQLLKARRYNLITISYENFSIQDKIDKQVKYLKECMNSVQHATST